MRRCGPGPGGCAARMGWERPTGRAMVRGVAIPMDEAKDGRGGGAVRVEGVR